MPNALLPQTDTQKARQQLAARRRSRRAGQEHQPEQVIEVEMKRGARMIDSLSDAELVARVQKGNKADFQILVERYQQRAFSVAWQILKRHEDAQDVVQEAFVKAYLSIDSFQGSSSFFTWFYRIVVNMAIDFRRKIGRTEKDTVSLDVEARDGIEKQADTRLVSQPQNPLDIALRGEQAQQINQVLGRISEDHRAVVVLREIEGLRYEQIAKVLGISKGTVMSRLFYARKRLQQLLNEVWRNSPEKEGAMALNTGKTLPSN